MKCNRCYKTLLGNEYQDHHTVCRASRRVRILPKPAQPIQSKPVIKIELKKKRKKNKPIKSLHPNQKIANQKNEINSLLKQIEELKAKNIPEKKKIISKTTHWLYDSDRWKALRYDVFKRFGFKCLACNATNVELHIDHIVPVSKDRSKAFEIENLQVLCRDCNLSKSNKHSDDLRFKQP